MALNKELEIYENTTKNIGCQEDEIYDTVNLDQCESVTEGNDTRDKDVSITPPSSIACKNHLQFVLIGFLYAMVFACIFWNIYSEYNGKDDLKQEVRDYTNTMYKDGLSELSKNVTDLEQQIKDSKTEKNNYMNMKAVMENIKQDLKESSSSVDDLKVATDEINTKCKNELSDLSKKVTELEKQIKDLNPASKSMVVAFNVMDAVSVTDNAIKFSNIILNEGYAYNKDTGIFTAPTDGIYQFNAHICCPKEKDINYYIQVSGNQIVTGEFRVPDGTTGHDNKCTSFSAVALVRKGENVRVGGMTTEEVADYSDDFCSFSGTLIYNV